MAAKKVVNVASVPQRSPFRYPGGKTWLVPVLRAWLRGRKTGTFVEPFAGGGIISLTVAFEKLAGRVVMVELDRSVAAVWKTVLGENASWLGQRIMGFDLTADSVRAELARQPESTREMAFQTILKNRVCHGGIMAPGSGFINSGEYGKGIRSRWYPATLRDRIEAIGQVRDQIEFVEGDGIKVLRAHAGLQDAACFIDPPYTAAGKKAGRRLYAHNELDHDELFRVVGTLGGDFLMTYDNAEGIVEMARNHGFDTEAIPMKNTHHAQMTELLIGRDLKWVRSMSRSQEAPTLFPE